MWRILVADDVQVNRELVLDILDGYAECDVAADGKEAIEKINASLPDAPYDLLLLDIAMPEVNGLDVLKRIRDNEGDAGIPLGDGMPVIMVTAYTQPCIESFDRGCDDYIVKPV
ncbi:MAG: response regulator, partial [Bacteroides sp.]|nr:response regulator [Bacteroides sp.]